MVYYADMSYVTYAWIATIIYGFETIIIKLSSKYAIKNPWLFNILWNGLFVVFMIPIYLAHPITLPSTWTSLLIVSLLSAASCILFMIATYRIDVSVLSPLYNVRTGLTVLFASFLLGEHMSSYQNVLVGIIILMGFLVTIDEKFSFKSFFRKDILIAMVFMVLLALYGVYLKKTIVDIGYWNATVWVALLTFVFLLPTYPKFVGDFKTLTKKQIIPVIVVTATSTLAYVISNKAYESHVGITTVIMSFPTSMVIAFVLALVWPKLMERHPMKIYALRFTAAAIMFVCAVQLTTAQTEVAQGRAQQTAKQQDTERFEVTQIIADSANKQTVRVARGETALALLQRTAQVRVKTYSYGTLVESINGQQNGTDKKYWTYRVNSKEVPVGAADYKVKAGDIITWEFKAYE